MPREPVVGALLQSIQQNSRHFVVGERNRVRFCAAPTAGRDKSWNIRFTHAIRTEPRLIETGWRMGDDVEVTKGLAPGERIVISGTFFIDSETRMKSTP